MSRHGAAGGDEAAEVDHSAHAGGSGLAREVLGRRPLALAESAGVPIARRGVGDRLHRMHQEVGDIDVAHRLGQSLPGHGIADDDRWARLRVARTAAEAAHGVALALEAGRQARSDEAGDPGHKYVHRDPRACDELRAAIRRRKLRKLHQVSLRLRNIPLFAGI